MIVSVDWARLQRDLRAGRRRPPDGIALADLTAELTEMLGDPDPQVRDQTAYAFLATWIEHGVYDDLLAGFGDGMCAGLETGLGERDTDSVFRRSFSVALLGECIQRDSRIRRLPPEQGAALGRPDRRVVRPRARPARLRPHQGVGAHRRPRR